MLEAVNLARAFARIARPWHPHIVADLNGQQVKLAKLDGAFVWHQHPDADELFLVLTGTLRMELRDRTVTIRPGELFVVPRGVEHRPVAEGAVEVVLFEPAGTRNTGTLENEFTVEPERL